MLGVSGVGKSALCSQLCIFRVLMLGGSGVGKSALCSQFCIFRVLMLGGSGVGKSALCSQFVASEKPNTYLKIGKKMIIC